MIVLPTIGTAGRFRLFGRRPDGRLRPVAPWQNNLILDSGLDRMAVAGDYLDACQLGDSVVSPSTGQKQLESYVAGTSTRIAANSGASGFEPWRGFSQITYEFPVGAVELVRELGIGWQTVDGPVLFSRALIRDFVGDVAPVEFFPDEQAIVEYELSCYAPLEDSTVLVEDTSIEGQMTAIIRPALASTGMWWAPYNATSYASSSQAALAAFNTTPGSHARVHEGVLGSRTASPGGASVNATDIEPQSYVPGSFQQVADIVWDYNVANDPFVFQTLFLAFRVGSGVGGQTLGAFQIQLVPTTVKPSTDEARATLGLQWGRYDP